MSLTAEAALWIEPVTVLISELAPFAASSFRAASAVVTSEVSSWSVGVSWFIHEYVFGRQLWTQLRTLGALALVPMSDGG